MFDVRKSQPFSANEWFCDYLPSSPLVRRAIRDIWKDNDLLRHYLMGFVTTRGNIKPIHVDCFSHSCVNDRRNRNKFFCQKCHTGNL
ncbi:MAG: hypothetical protein OIN88_15400, partial [Candidatus Methanoperedens sp.]|nr:hypothetical protein [Candidatus Methanoperedens sp.]